MKNNKSFSGSYEIELSKSNLDCLMSVVSALEPEEFPIPMPPEMADEWDHLTKFMIHLDETESGSYAAGIEEESLKKVMRILSGYYLAAEVYEKTESKASEMVKSVLTLWESITEQATEQNSGFEDAMSKHSNAVIMRPEIIQISTRRYNEKKKTF